MKKEKPVIIKNEISRISEEVFLVSITDEASLKQSVSILSQLNKFNDQIKTEKDKVLAPLLEAVKAERSRWKPAEEQNQSLIDDIRLKMTRYQTALVQSNKQQEQSIAARIAPGKGNLSLNTAVKKIENLPIINKETATEEGLVQFREKKVLKITNPSIVSDEYWIIDQPALLEALKEGKIVYGAELEIIQVPVNYR